jgi:hypothetical protein
MAVLATQLRPTFWYKVDVIFKIQCHKGLLLDQICINLMPAYLLVNISLDSLYKYGIELSNRHIHYSIPTRPYGPDQS